jgi:hypothetical protein
MMLLRETEAKAVAFVDGKTIGLRTNRASADYNFALRMSARIIETAAPWFLLDGKIERQSRDRAGRIHRVWMSVSYRRHIRSRAKADKGGFIPR